MKKSELRKLIREEIKKLSELKKMINEGSGKSKMLLKPITKVLETISGKRIKRKVTVRFIKIFEDNYFGFAQGDDAGDNFSTEFRRIHSTFNKFADEFNDFDGMLEELIEELENRDITIVDDTFFQ